jgi:hypothetical protein
MKGFVPPDIQTDVSKIHYAVVHVPKLNRKRFSAGCVQVTASEKEAKQQANPAEKHYAARVLGPSKSSEGQIIYYLVEWL